MGLSPISDKFRDHRLATGDRVVRALTRQVWTVFLTVTAKHGYQRPDLDAGRARLRHADCRCQDAGSGQVSPTGHTGSVRSAQHRKAPHHGARRHARHRRPAGHGLPLQARPLPRRVRRRHGVLHAVRLPDLLPHADRGRPQRPLRGRRLLRAPGPPARSGRHRLHPRRRRPDQHLGTHEQHASVPGDAIASLANVANWRFLVHGTSYADLFAAPSPLNHFWSLAIEEQFYLVFPVVVWLLLKLPKRVARARHRAGGVGGARVVGPRGVGGRQLQPLLLRHRRPDGRELLVGVIAALGLSYWHVSVPRPAGVQRLAVMLLAAAGLASVVVGAMTYRERRLDLPARRRVFIALATAALIIGGLEGSNGVARLCSVRRWSTSARSPTAPTSTTGRSSRCPASTGVRCTAPALGLAQLAASLLLAAVSFRFLEAPIQRRRFAQTRRSMLRGWAVALAGVACVTLALALLHPARGTSRFASASSAMQTSRRRSRSSRAPSSRGRDAPTGRCGCSSPGIPRPRSWPTLGRPIRMTIRKRCRCSNLSLPGCPITPTDPHPQLHRGERPERHALSEAGDKTFPPQIAKFKPDVSLVFLSVMEVTDQRTVNGNWDNLLDPAYRAQQESAFDTLIADLSATGAPVAWADAPYFQFQADLPWISESTERTDRAQRHLSRSRGPPSQRAAARLRLALEQTRRMSSTPACARTAST